MSSVARITAEINLKDNLSRPVEEAGKKVETFGKKAQAAFTVGSASMDSFAKGLGNVGQKASIAGAIITASLTTPILGFAKASVDAAAKMESMRASMTAITGSTSAAKEQLANLEAMAGRTATSYDLLVKASMGLTAGFDGDVKGANKVLEKFAVLSNVMNVTRADFDRLATNLIQIGGASRLTGDELKEMAAILPNLRSLLKEAFGTSSSEELAKYGISGRQALEGIMKAIDAQGFKANTDTYNAQLQVMSTEFFKLKVAAGEALMPIAKDLVEKLTPAFKDLAEKIKSLTGEQRETLLKAIALTAALGPLAVVVGTVTTAISGALKAAALLRTGLLLLAGANTLVAGSSTAAAAGITATGAAAAGATKQVGLFRAALMALTAHPWAVVLTLTVGTVGMAGKAWSDLGKGAGEQFNRTKDMMRTEVQKQVEAAERAIKRVGFAEAKKLAGKYDPLNPKDFYDPENYKRAEENVGRRGMYTGVQLMGEIGKQRRANEERRAKAAAEAARKKAEEAARKKGGGRGGGGGGRGSAGEAPADPFGIDSTLKASMEQAKKEAEEVKRITEQTIAIQNQLNAEKLKAAGATTRDVLAMQEYGKVYDQILLKHNKERIDAMAALEDWRNAQQAKDAKAAEEKARLDGEARARRALNEAVAQSAASLQKEREQINFTTEEEKARWEVTNGGYAKASGLAKALYVTQARLLDQARKSKETSEKWAEVWKKIREQGKKWIDDQKEQAQSRYEEYLQRLTEEMLELKGAQDELLRADLAEQFKGVVAGMVGSADAMKRVVESARIGTILTDPKEQEAANKLKLMIDEIMGKVKDLAKAREYVRMVQEIAQGIERTFEQSLDALFENGFKGFFRSVIDGFRDMARQIAAEFLKQQLIKMLLWGVGQIGGAGAKADLAKVLPGKASGGSVFGGQPYIVGERGPEVFVPNVSGAIRPNDAAPPMGRGSATAGAGAGGGTIIVNLQVPNHSAFRRSEAQAVATVFARAARSRAREGR